jgi:HlyD family secretion protein
MRGFDRGETMRKLLPFISLVTVVALALGACGGGTKQTPTPVPEPAFASLVSVTGEVVPAKWAALSMQGNGVVTDVLVEPGDEVKAGDLLVKLDTVEAELAVQEAEAQLLNARAQVKQLEAQPRAMDVAAAEQQVDDAEVAISQAVAERDQVASGVIASDIAEAEAALASAEAELKAVRIDYDELQADLESGVVEDWEGERAALQLLAARENLEAAQLGLAYARGSASARMEEAEAGVVSAQAQRDVTQAQLEGLKAGVSEEEIALAETEVARAEIALREAQIGLERCERRAPFDGTVGMVDVREGERVQQGDLILTVGDLSTLRVETTDLDEINVARVAVGQSVDVTFDAFPDRVFEGRVVRINPMAEGADGVSGGGVNYTTIIELEELAGEGASEIRWGMTAFVDIDVGQ